MASPLHEAQFGPLFHGTRANLGVGDTVLPANKAKVEIGTMTWGDPDINSAGDHAFVMHGSGDHGVTDKVAEDYAWNMASNNTNTAKAERPRVVEVAPSKDMEPGDYHFDSPLSHATRVDTHGVSTDEYLKDLPVGDPKREEARGYLNQPEYRSKTGFKVTKVHDIMPGRQGTFPNINWAQFADHNKVSGGPSWLGRVMNHPTDRDISRPDDYEKELAKERARIPELHALQAQRHEETVSDGLFSKRAFYG